MAKKKEASFEENLEQLETIVGEMEKGDLSLTDLMEKYKEGMELSKKCSDALKTAEETIDLIIKADGVQEFKLELEG